MSDVETVLVLQHQDDAPSGNLIDWFEQNAVQYLVVDATGHLPPPEDYRAVVCLGSRESVFDVSVDWIAPERAFLKETAAAGTPIIGICFGAQQLATISGGTVTRMEEPERGWTTVAGDTPFGGRWFAWHQDQITPATDAVVLARSDRSVQAFRTGAHIGVQFHPEITVERVRDWMDQSARIAAVTAVGSSAEAVLTETEAVKAQARAAAFQLYSSLLSRTLRHPGSTR